MKIFKYTIVLTLFAAILPCIWGCNASAGSLGTSDKLLSSLRKLGFTSDQATGGLGALMALAKFNLSKENFSKVTKVAIPDIKEIMKDANAVGANTGSIKDINDVAASFEKLGMNAGDINKFIPVITKYVESKVGKDESDLLAGALK